MGCCCIIVHRVERVWYSLKSGDVAWTSIRPRARQCDVSQQASKRKIGYHIQERHCQSCNSSFPRRFEPWRCSRIANPRKLCSGLSPISTLHLSSLLDKLATPDSRGVSGVPEFPPNLTKCSSRNGATPGTGNNRPAQKGNRPSYNWPN